MPHIPRHPLVMDCASDTQRIVNQGTLCQTMATTTHINGPKRSHQVLILSLFLLPYTRACKTPTINRQPCPFPPLLHLLIPRKTSMRTLMSSSPPRSIPKPMPLSILRARYRGESNADTTHDAHYIC
jgi:hypothetical protein